MKHGELEMSDIKFLRGLLTDLLSRYRLEDVLLTFANLVDEREGNWGIQNDMLLASEYRTLSALLRVAVASASHLRERTPQKDA